MSIEFITELESKIDALIESYNAARRERDELQTRLDEANGRMGELERENQELKGEIERLGGASAEQQNKLDSAAERIQTIISKLEAVS
ncbi:MAG: cell division protein ZapB [Chitinivibrionales bacterium]|nr:cell division protein ZapB [Chitinivibrionales bacterium]MBD3357928.1 cell division protein ZapB [Chitinivibrionales bacterium]